MVLANEASFEISLGRLKDMTVNTACQNRNQFCHYFFEAHFRIWGKNTFRLIRKFACEIKYTRFEV